MPRHSSGNSSSANQSCHRPTSSDGKDVIPPPPANAVPTNFLIKLLEACTKHKRRHEREDTTTNDDVDNNNGSGSRSSDGGSGKLTWCHNELNSFARILPRMESTIAVRNTFCDEYRCRRVENNVDSTGEGSSLTATSNGNVSSSSSLEPMKEEDSVGHLCALYRAIARGAFCPHAYHYLFVESGSNGGGAKRSSANEAGPGDGERQDFHHEQYATDADIVEGVLPRITKLLQYMASDPVRMALSPLPLPQRSSKQCTPIIDEEAIKLHYQEEDIGSTIAALLNLVHDHQLRLCAVHDLINLSNDLSVIDESNALFDPPMSTNEEVVGDDVTRTATANGDKIRVQVFTELARHLPNKLNEKYMVSIPSRRSLLAIQLGVWTALHRLIPAIFDGDDVMSRNPIETFAMHGPSRKVTLINSLLSASRSTSLVLPRRSHHDPQFIYCTYSSDDLKVHSLLILRTKLAVVGLFTDIVAGGGGLVESRHSLHDELTLAPSIDIALMAVDAAKYHLMWDRVDGTESSALVDHDGIEAKDQLSSLNSMCCWAISNFLALALLFPDTTLTTSLNDIWSYCFPSLIDCIPLMTDPSNTCLRKVMVRSIHAILSSSAELVVKQSTLHQNHGMLNASSGLEYLDQHRNMNTPCFLDHFSNRCLVRGYFSCLFELVQDSDESISCPAIAIVTLLLEMSSGFLTTMDLLESACSRALEAVTPLDRGDSELPMNTCKDSPMVRLGSKRRKLVTCEEGKEVPLTSSIESAFAHAISDALADARDVMKNCAEGNVRKISSSSGGAELVTLVFESDVPLLRSVAGVLRILMSLRKAVSQNQEAGQSFADKIIARLFDAVEFMSRKLVQQKSHGKLVHIEPKLLYDTVSSIVSVGLHACRDGKTSITALSARVAMSHCALSTLPMIEFGLSCELRDDQCTRQMTKVKRSRLCGGICCRLASMIGAIARPSIEVCLCGLVYESNGRLEDECGAFVLDNTLPLQCRCILLAMMSPVSADAVQLESTLYSIGYILTESSRLQAPMIVTTALLLLPNLFWSLSNQKDGNDTASAKYLTIMMNSFNFEDCVLQHTKSDIEEIKVGAFLSLSRLTRMYVAASLVASSKDPEIDRIDASSYLWLDLNPTTKGIHHVLQSLWYIDEYSFTAHQDSDFHPSLGLPVVTNEYSSAFSLAANHAPRQWMATLLYLQSYLAVVPESILRSSNIIEFFSDSRRYGIYEELVKEMNGPSKGEELSSIPPPVWLFLMPFVSSDKSTQLRAAEMLGQTLFRNGCKVFSAFFVPKSATQHERNTAQIAVDKLFSEIDFILGLCGLKQEVLVSELELVSTSHNINHASDVGIAICVFPSLVRWASLNTALGRIILERSLLALVRIWIASAGGFAFDTENTPDSPSCNSSLASNAFDQINEVFKCSMSDPDSSHSADLLEHVRSIIPKIFVEFFLPQFDIAASIRYRLLSMFIGSFLIPSPVTKKLRVQNTFEVSSVFELIEFIDGAYLPVIVQMIKDEDHEAIQMCAAFRMYLLSEAKKVNKEERRVQKKNLDELFLGSRLENKCLGPLSRSLVPGVSISTSKLIENAKLLCIKNDVISYVLPQLLLHPGQAPLRFFTTKVCQSELDYPDILRGIGLSVLKTLVWELGGDDPDEDSDDEMYDSSCSGQCPTRKDVRLALTKGYLLKDGNSSSKLNQILMSPTQDSAVDGELCTSAAGRWVAPNIMFLLVNIVLHQWPKRTERERFQVVKCLRAILQFLPPSDSPQYIPQIMTAINNALSSTMVPGGVNLQLTRLRYIAVATLFDFIKIVTSHDASQVGGNLIIIVVALLPLFDSGVSDCENDMARRHAVQMLEWLAMGEVDDSLPRYFSEIPFLPFTRDLANFRAILVQKGVHLDDINIMSQHVESQAIGTSDPLLESRFYNRMNILSQLLLSQESQNVRKVVITHLTALIKANRDLFRNLIVNEELSSMNFLTVVHDAPSKMNLNAVPDDDVKFNWGFITKLLIRLLSRCVDESDSEIRDAIASCLGEIGAIDPNRLSKAINFSQFVANSAESDNSGEWRLMNPPWKTQIAAYQLRLMTRHLVFGLKSAPTTLDQHKISFAIQELLKIMDLQMGGENENEMSPLLKTKLQEAGVSNIVEPFWTTNYKQVDTTNPKSPPFFTKSHNYFSWLSSFSRYLVSRSNANKRSVWGDFFHACRSAIRSKAGVGVSEFLMPLLVLDSLCFGVKSDEDVVVDELLHVLSFGGECPMNLREREKATNAVFTVLDVLRHWFEKEAELRSHLAKGRSKRVNIPTADEDESSWPAAESSKKIERLLKRIPHSSCARAASEVGMRARALQFLEMEGRSIARLNDNSLNGDFKGASKFVASNFIRGVDLKLTQSLLGRLNDFDTMLFVEQKNHDSDLTKRLTDEAAEREMYEDWEGSYQAYEQLLDSRLTTENEGLVEKGLLRCLLKLGRIDSALNQAFGMSKQSPGLGKLQIRGDLLPSAAEAAWRLGNWQVLDDLVNNLNDESSYDADERYQLSFGRAMHSLHSKSNAGVAAFLKDSRESVISSLSSAARDGYTRSYPYLVQLHALREVECLSTLFFEEQSSFHESFIKIMASKEWRDRLELSTSDTTGSNAIMITRLALSRMANEPTIEASLWLDIGKVARKAGLYIVAQHSFTQANVAYCKSLTVDDKAREAIGIVKLQVAKLKYAVGESTMALKLIEDEIPTSIFLMDDEQLEAFVSSDTVESREVAARRILQATDWMASDGLKSSLEIKDRYQTVLKLTPNWERAHFTYAKFLDSMFESRASAFKGRSADAVSKIQERRAEAIRSVQECQECLLGSIQHYGIALQLGQKHVYQALPRLLAMWLEFTALEGKDVTDRLSTNQSTLNNIIKSLAKNIPEHLFYTTLPQLISRVVHQNDETSNNVALIIRNVLAKYPRQALWSCGWLRFSKSKDKKKAGDEIFHGAQVMLRKTERDVASQNLLSASKSLFQFFISLARFNPKPSHTAVKMKVPTFDTELKNFIPPIQAALSLSPGALEGSTDIDVFPSFAPRMRAFNPELKIMQSKAKPKKVSIFAVPSTVARRDPLPMADHSIAQDVGEIHFLVKQEAKGDLRKDSRVQDLNNVINRLFASRKGSSGPNSRRRKLRLQLRTFSVVCLAEDCGILEWVPSTESLRSVISDTYNPQVAPESVHRRGSRITNYADLELKDAFSKCQELFFKKGNLEMAAKKFDELILQQYLPVMYWWFVQKFSSPHAWYEARSNFTLSTAVWSAVGHIIGLGDRHSENILIDTSSGECVHVDFDCIFDKGLDLPRPEVIPFRLTPNILDAFGPTGSDGMFTGALIESMRTLRKNRDTLLSVLEPFLNDPVINFKSKSQKNSKDDKKEDFISNIEGRLDGEYNLINTNLRKLGRDKDAPTSSETDHITKLSVEGQVQKMIMEATSKENLVQVYVGWMPWI